MEPTDAAAPRQDTLDRVRSTCRRVSEQARHVRLRRDRIVAYAERLARETPPIPELDTETHFVGNTEETATYFFVLDAINFGSGYFPYLTKRPGMSGYFTIASSLTDRFRSSGTLSAEALSTMDWATCCRLFGQSPSNAPILELMERFAEALRDLGGWLTERFHGSALRALEVAEGSAARLVDLLCEMPCFRDEARYAGAPVFFYKRAQILSSDLALAFGNEPPARFTDLDRLTLFADNLVPHVLRIDGLLEYTPDLARRIDAEEPLPAGSDQELELRACAVDTVEHLVSALANLGTQMTARDLDLILWNRGQCPEIKRAAPRHRTRSVFY